MAAYLLYYREVSRAESTNAYMKRFATLHAMSTIVIDRKGDMPGSALRFATLDDALADPTFEGYTWVWLDAAGEDGFLDEYEHPVDQVIYCVGSDFIGFDSKPLEQLPGVKVQMRQVPSHEGEWYASIIAPLVVYDRFLYLTGRRK